MNSHNTHKTIVGALGVIITGLIFALIFYGGLNWLRPSAAQPDKEEPTEGKSESIPSGKESVPDKPSAKPEPDGPLGHPAGDKNPAKAGPKESKDVLTLDQKEKVYLKEKKMEIEAIIANPNMPLELFGCTEGGKDYESLVVLKCQPHNIQMVLILFGLKEGKGPEKFGDATKPTGDPVLVFLEWKDDKDKTLSYRGEDLIIDMRTKKPWPRVGWSFTGSRFEADIDFDTGKPTGRQIFLADATKTVIATYHDPAAILDNPTASGGVGNIYFPNKELLPKAGTPCKVIIRVPDDKEKEELKKVNEEVAKWEKEEQEKWEKEQKEREKQEKEPEKK